MNQRLHVETRAIKNETVSIQNTSFQLVLAVRLIWTVDTEPSWFVSYSESNRNGLSAAVAYRIFYFYSTFCNCLTGNSPVLAFFHLMQTITLSLNLDATIVFLLWSKVGGVHQSPAALEGSVIHGPIMNAEMLSKKIVLFFACKCGYHHFLTWMQHF